MKIQKFALPLFEKIKSEKKRSIKKMFSNLHVKQFISGNCSGMPFSVNLKYALYKSTHKHRNGRNMCMQRFNRSQAQ